MAQPAQPETKLLWNPENVKDVAESVGISSLNEDALRVLTQDAEYRIGQVVIEALRFMRAARRTTLTVGDIAQALRVLDVEPLYGYESTRPLRYGEASLGPGQPLYYLEDEEVDFEKLINAPLPKVPRDMSFTAHWLAIEGVQPSIPQNPTTAESRSQDQHIISKELGSLLWRRSKTLSSTTTQTTRWAGSAMPLSPPSSRNQVTHRLDDVFTLRRVKELTEALIENTNLLLDPTSTSSREFSASLLGKIALRYAASNHLLRPKLVRTCLKFFMDPDKLPAAHYGAITGLAAAGGPEAVRVLVLKYLRAYSDEVLQRLKDKGEGLDFELLVGGIVRAIATLVADDRARANGVNGGPAATQTAELKEFIGPILGERIAGLGNKRLVEQVLEARTIQ
ncbi:transcription initiation factor TFIID subunit 6 [Verticillium dahliae VdLs.17]|uniref:TBP-associated factor 6 n=1 Tax=Verticillium dahliae (strain VdLs.17 / ATCC MYA-4575 / FGSC 10137) TaxID=498257 RepID=G2XGN3_VERDV|nr:transcription initiation factor TFIID subunit 6 [Verticillium dahliae VdLs.17]EGY18981.1 transcription initiation factor TFIID subunit 6 [Verticillium dahliae VdLs.17]